MISTTHNGTDVYLLNQAPSWESDFKATAALTREDSVGLSGREARRGYTGLLRFDLAFDLLMTGVEARQFEAAWRERASEPVLVPLWPVAVKWTDRATRSITGGLNVVFSPGWADWSLYEDGGTPGYTPADTDMLVPVLWGLIDDVSMAWLNADLCRVAVKFKEAGPAAYAVAIAEHTFTAGPMPNGSYTVEPRVWPFRLDLADGVDVSRDIAVHREWIGFGREPLERRYRTRPDDDVDQYAILVTTTEVSQALRFLIDHGPGRAFWVPMVNATTDLVADVPSSATQLTVADLTGVTAGDWLAFYHTGTEVLAWAKVESTDQTGGRHINLASAVGPYDRRFVVVSQLVLRRLAQPQMDLVWRHSELVTLQLRARAVPEEVAIPADETLGTTIGELPVRVYLYEFIKTLAGVPYTNRYTSYEVDLAYDGYAYAAAKVSHGTIRRGMYLDRDETTIEMDAAAGTMLRGLVNGTLNVAVQVVILAGDKSGTDAVNVVTLFRGEVRGVSYKANLARAKVISGGSLFDRLLPRRRIQPGCNHVLFDGACGLAIYDWTFTGDIDIPGTPGYPYSFGLKNLARLSGPTPDYFENWFAGGWIEFGTDADLHRLPILKSSEVTGGLVTVWLSGDPYPYPAENDAVTLYPGCDGRMETCRAYNGSTNPEGKFDNWANFGGFPFVPAANPSLIRVSQQVGGGKK